MRARALADLGDYAGAAQAFGAATAITPRSVDLWADIARFRLRRGDRLGAIRASDHAVALDRNNVDALVLKGELVRDQYGLVASLSWFEKALTIDRLDLDAQLEQAATLGDLGRTQEMLAVTRAIQALDPTNPRAFYLQAVLAARARNFVLADKLIDQIGGTLDDVPGMLLLKGTVAHQLGNFSEAADALGRLVELQPDNATARRLLASTQWRLGDFDAVTATLAPIADDSYALTLMARAYEALGDRQTAAGYLDRAANLHASVPLGLPVQPRDDEAGASATVALARRLLASGDVRQGLDVALALQRDNPGAPDAHMLAGDAWTAAGRPMAAVEAYRRAANLRFSETIALRMIAALSRAGRSGEAVRVLDLFLSQNPASVRARMLQADLLMARGRFADAASTLEYLRQRSGDGDVAIASNLAWCYYRMDRIADAIAIADQAYRLAPSNPRITHSYGWILHKSGRNPRGALALLRQAAAQAPDWPLARAHLTEAETVHATHAIG
jgi:tetratricopeptide (TPR) repeat protein